MVMACGSRWNAARVLAIASAVGAGACARPNPAFEGETETDGVGGETGEDGDGIGATSQSDGGAVDGTAGGEDDALPDEGSTGTCGDEVLDDGEECDDGERNDDKSSCKSDCTHNVCGDGFKGPGQPCDDANEIAGDGCTDCMLDSCGDGIVDDGEACDPQDPVTGAECTPLCTIPECGDDFESPGEECDDGNGDETDECTNACTIPVCGDGIVTETETYVEECDDENNVDDDACFGCVMAFCGDGHVSPGIGEQCEPGVMMTIACVNSEMVPGVFTCNEAECTWATADASCCVQSGLPCVGDDMCCGEMQCLDGVCVEG
jgi:hypothetical protein